MPSGSGVVDGMKNVSKGESLALFARPQKGHIFTGWTGDIQSADNPLYLREISSNFNVTANFESVRDFLSSGKIDSSLSWLPSEKLRDKAILELAAFGYSSVLFPQSGPPEPTSDLASLLLSMGTQNASDPTLVFDSDSAIITHPLTPWKTGDAREAYSEGSQRGMMTAEAKGTEITAGVSCLKIEFSFSAQLIETRWSPRTKRVMSGW